MGELLEENVKDLDTAYRCYVTVVEEQGHDPLEGRPTIPEEDDTVPPD